MNDRHSPVIPALRRSMAAVLAQIVASKSPVAATSVPLGRSERHTTLQRMESHGLVERAGELATGRRPAGLWRATPRGRLLAKLIAQWEAGP